MQRKYINIIILLFFSILIAVFAVQNASPVPVKLWMVEFDSSISIVILFSIALGVIITSILMFFEIRKKQKQVNELNKKVEKLQNELKSKETPDGF